jgi:hypothetical protein
MVTESLGQDGGHPDLDVSHPRLLHALAVDNFVE